MTISWQGKLDEATTEHEVIMAARDFLARFTPDEIERLPTECRPGKFFEADDVTAYAVALVRHECGADAESGSLVHDFAAFFSNASMRLSQIMAHRNTSRQSA